MAAVTITVVDKYLLLIFLEIHFKEIKCVATRYWAVIKSNYMLGHPKRYKYFLKSKNFMLLDNQQERLSNTVPANTHYINWFISGFIDGEGSFCLNIKNRNNVKYGLRIEPAFYVYQHEKGLDILKLIQSMFDTGSIHRKSNPSNVFTYQISGITPCFTKVIPFFKKYPLIVKSEAFEIFSEAVTLMYYKKHLNRTGFLKLVDYAYKINRLGKGKKWDRKIVIDRILRG